MPGDKKFLNGSPFSPLNIVRLIANLPNLAVLYFRLLLDPRVKLGIKIIPLFGLLYIISPYDIMPDFMVPAFGWVDDIVVFYFCMRIFGRLVPREIIDEHIRAIERSKRGR